MFNCGGFTLECRFIRNNGAAGGASGQMVGNPLQVNVNQPNPGGAAQQQQQQHGGQPNPQQQPQAGPQVVIQGANAQPQPQPVAQAGAQIGIQGANAQHQPQPAVQAIGPLVPLGQFLDPRQRSRQMTRDTVQITNGGPYVCGYLPNGCPLKKFERYDDGSDGTYRISIPFRRSGVNSSFNMSPGSHEMWRREALIEQEEHHAACVVYKSPSISQTIVCYFNSRSNTRRFVLPRGGVQQFARSISHWAEFTPINPADRLDEARSVEVIMRR